MDVIDTIEETIASVSSGGGSISQKTRRKPDAQRQTGTKVTAIPNTAAAATAAGQSLTAQSQNSKNSSITIPMDSIHIEKKCENPDCSAPTLISLVPSRRTAQFIHDPTVVPEPILVNGYTTVFEVGGITAKINELTTFRGQDGKIRYKSPKPIFRIVPNTHAHIVNYIIVDAEGHTLQMIKQNDPVTIKKLLDSQKNSAEQLLQKLIGIRKDDNQVRTVAVPMQKSNVRAPNTVGTTSPMPIVTPQVPQTPQVIQTASQVMQTAPQVVQIAKSVQSVQTPITTVRTAVKVAPTLTGVGLNATPPVPTPIVPSTCSLPAPIVVNPVQGAAIPAELVNSSAIERMQSQLRELQETVKLLTEQKRASEEGTTDGSAPKKQKTS